jgi:hypothetical protein
MRTLYDASLRVHEHLIPLQVATPSNVVAFKTRGPSSTQN